MNYRIGSFKIAQWIIHPDLNRISGPKGEEIVGPRIMQLLVFLAQQEGNVVTREDLLTHVWDDVHVNEESITKSISILRNAFELTAEKITVIETIRSIGYRIVLPVEFDIINTGKKRRDSGLSSFSIKNSYVQFGVGTFLIASLIAVFAFDVFAFDYYSEPVAISKLPGPERVPKISPDGKKVVFAWDGPGAVNYDIFIRDLETSELIQLTSGGFLDTDPMWSPDGEDIVFYRNNGQSVSIQSVNIETGFTNRIANAHDIPNLSAMSWSHDGKYIVFSDRAEPEKRDPFSLYLLNYETGKVKPITFPEYGIVGDISPKFSKDDRFIAFIRGTKGSDMFGHIIPAIGDIMILDLESDSIKQVTQIDTEITGLDWESDDQTILFSSIANYFTFRISKLDLRDEKYSTLYETSNIVRNLSTRQDHKLMAYEEWQEEVVLKKLDLNDDSFVGAHYIAEGSRHWYPQLSKDETKLSYVSLLSGASELWVRDLNKGTSRQLTSLKGPIVHKPRWSPNGEWIAFCTEDKSGRQIHIVSAIDENPEIVTFFDDIENGACLPSWSEDGGSIFFRSNGLDNFAVLKAKLSEDYKLVVDTTKVLDIATILLEERGDYLYYSKRLEHGIWQFDKRSGEEVEIISEFRNSDWANWELNNGNIFYYIRDEYGRATLMKYDIDAGTKERMHDFLINLPWIYAGFTYSNSENAFIFSSTDNVSSEVMLMSFR